MICWNWRKHIKQWRSQGTLRLRAKNMFAPAPIKIVVWSAKYAFMTIIKHVLTRTNRLLIESCNSIWEQHGVWGRVPAAVYSLFFLKFLLKNKIWISAKCVVPCATYSQRYMPPFATPLHSKANKAQALSSYWNFLTASTNLSYIFQAQTLDTLATLCGDEIFFITPSPARYLRFPRRNWPFPALSAVNSPNFAATVTAFSCPSYLCRIKRNSSCSACRHPQQDRTHLLLDCPAFEPLRRAIFNAQP